MKNFSVSVRLHLFMQDVNKDAYQISHASGTQIDIMSRGVAVASAANVPMMK
jgi:hypothetical protein